MWMSALFLAVSLVAVAYLSRRQTPPPPRRNLIIAVVVIVVIRVAFYVAFRLFNEREILLATGMLLLVSVLVAISFGSVAVWKQMGGRHG